jgi:RND superfamily putative drug exporter
MILMGKINWYMPRWLDRLVPHVSIEGAEYFAKRDAQAGPPREPLPVGSAEH